MPVVQVSKPMFETTDGVQFQNEADAIQYQVTIDMKEPINEYLEELELKPRGRQVRYNLIMEWEQAKALSNLQSP